MEKALLVTVKLQYDDSTGDVVEFEHELEELAKTAGAEVVKKVICHRDKPTPDLYVGEGKTEEIGKLVADCDVHTIIFNNELTGTQKRNLEKELGVKVIDRTQLILDIFARRAKSPEGKAQVELAQLEYSLPRLGGKGVELSRLGGGIGTRGPGEQKLEEDRRRVRDRIALLKNELKGLEEKRDIRRRKRDAISLPTIVFVGYTSAGKSTLFNVLTSSAQPTNKGLFTTLDPLSRGIALGNHQKVILSDTVGFIRQLPTQLIEAFKATLEEVVDAVLLVHVLDVSSPKARDHFEAVMEVLDELGAGDREMILVLNKIDLFENEEIARRITKNYPSGIAISALKHQNLDALLKEIEKRLAGFLKEVELVLPSEKMDLVDFIYRQGQVKEIEYQGKEVLIKAVLPEVAAEKLKRYLRRV